MCSLVNIDNKVKYVLNFDKGLTYGLNDTKLTTEKEYSQNFTKQQEKICSSLNYNWVNNYIFVNSVEICKFKASHSEINAAPLCFDIALKDFLVDNMEQTGLYGYFNGFSVDYDSIGVDIILDTHKYLMKKYNIMFRFIKKYFH